jgi:hypothetical protein
VKDGDGGHGRCELATAAAVVAEDPPVLQARKRVLHPSPAAAMAAPGAIADDPVAAEDGDAKARDTAVPAVGEDAVMLEAERVDLRAAEVNDVVAVARTAGRRGNGHEQAAQRRARARTSTAPGAARGASAGGEPILEVRYT